MLFNQNKKNQHHSQFSLLSVALLSVLFLLAILYFAWPLWRAQWPLEIDGNEAWNAFQIARMKSGKHLYPEMTALVTNNYPPLSFLLIRGLSEFGLEPIMIGRALSLLAILSIGGAIWASIRILHGSHFAAATGALWFVASTTRFYDVYVGMNDPHLPALALMAAALAWYLKALEANKPLEGPFILLVIGGFYKHSLIVFPTAMFVWLLLNNWKAAVRPALISGGATIVGFGACWLSYGNNFVDQLLAPRVTSLAHILTNLGRIQWIVPAILIWLWLSKSSWYLKSTRFCFVFVVCGLAGHFLQQIGDGVDDNSQFELIVGLALSVGFAIDRAKQQKLLDGHAVILSILIVRLLASNRVEPYLLPTSPEFRALGPSSVQIANSEIKRIADLSGTVSCSIMTICYQAGKEFSYYDFSVRQKLVLKQIPQVRLEEIRRSILFVSIDPAASMSTFRRAASALFVHRWIIY